MAILDSCCVFNYTIPIELQVFRNRSVFQLFDSFSNVTLKKGVQVLGKQLGLVGYIEPLETLILESDNSLPRNFECKDRGTRKKADILSLRTLKIKVL